MFIVQRYMYFAFVKLSESTIDTAVPWQENHMLKYQMLVVCTFAVNVSGITTIISCLEQLSVTEPHKILFQNVHVIEYINNATYPITDYSLLLLHISHMTFVYVILQWNIITEKRRLASIFILKNLWFYDDFLFETFNTVLPPKSFQICFHCWKSVAFELHEFEFNAHQNHV